MAPLMPVPRTARWVPSVLYAAVLIAGAYAHFAGLGQTHPALFAGGLAALALLDFAERRRFPDTTPRWAAATGLAVRCGLFIVVATADGSGLSRVLFLLLPFGAYFAFGRVAAIALGLLSLVLIVVALQLTVPEWHRSSESVADLLMFAIGLVLTLAMASVAAGEQAARARLEESTERLRDYAAQVAEMSTIAERNRLARDIHDGLGHHLTAITILLEKAWAFRDRDPETADRALDDAQLAARRALDDVRRSVRSLRADNNGFALAAALGVLVKEAGHGRPSIALECTGDESGYDQAALIALYRAAQEGLTNALRHAQPRLVTVSLHCGESDATLVVTDDGLGFPSTQEGFGLQGMRERVQLAGGTVDVHSGLGIGTRLTVVIPQRPAHLVDAAPPFQPASTQQALADFTAPAQLTRARQTATSPASSSPVARGRQAELDAAAPARIESAGNAVSASSGVHAGE